MAKKKFYITTAIDYPNARPHLGHALEKVQADAIARFQRLQGKDVFFQTGTDEHGTKIWRAAEAAKKPVEEFLDEQVAVFKELCKKLNISYDYFIRTTDQKIHYPGVIKLWNELVKSGDIFKQTYTGLYCIGCEAFKTEKELVNGKCPDHPTRQIEEVEEENYFFKLSKYKEQIISKIKSDEFRVSPDVRKHEILAFLENAKDISFSRPKTSLPWGIPVPGDDRQVMYVWCDALSNYITGIGYGRDEENFEKLWPADVHVIGKDILRFHAAFWPAMLLSAKIKLPKELFVHGWILSKGAKMGKSTGNVLDPFAQIEKYGVDPFRFYILGAMNIDGDGEYSEELLKERINTVLVSNLSNFCYRSMSFVNKNYDSEITGIDEDKVIGEVEAKFPEIKKAYEEYDFKKAIDIIMEVSALGNAYFQKKEPWKNPAESADVLGTCMNIIKNLAILCEPMMPEFSEKLKKQLKIKKLSWDELGFDLKKHRIGTAEILFMKIK
jgi:methionyl-tRNA synthetase